MTPPAAGDRLLGKVAIVTGAASGFGERIAQVFVSQGAKVVVADLNVENGTKVASIIPESMAFVKMDVTSESDWKNVIKQTVERFGRVDILVNNAGTTYKNKVCWSLFLIFRICYKGGSSGKKKSKQKERRRDSIPSRSPAKNPLQPTLEVTESDFDRVFNVNVKSIFFSVQHFIPQIMLQGESQGASKKGGGSIINIASIGATRPRPGLVWYNSSKGAVWNATKGLASEYGPQNIRVNAICPVLTATGLFESFTGTPDTAENRQKFLWNIPLGRLGEADDVAGYALYLASDEANFITGTCLEVDGGKGIA
ncbi:hypothetical protein B7463_g10146, partial [Scytalidium lignicola]